MNYIASASILIAIFYSFINIDVEGLHQRIIGGIRAQPKQVKYLVGIYRNNDYICGGGIIGNEYILTAAHCIVDSVSNKFKTGKLKIVAGTNNLRFNTPSTIKIDVKAAYVPLIYNGSLWLSSYPKGDIAVLELKNKLNLTENVNLQELLLPWNDFNFWPYGDACTRMLAQIAGFGKDGSFNYTNRQGKTESVWTASRILKTGTVSVNDYKLCNEKYWGTHFDSTVLCGRIINYFNGIPQGTCNGDSGSPLVQRNVTVIGVVSGGSSHCNNNQFPSIYTKVEAFKNFIENVKQGIIDDMRVRKY